MKTALYSFRKQMYREHLKMILNWNYLIDIGILLLNKTIIERCSQKKNLMLQQLIISMKNPADAG